MFGFLNSETIDISKHILAISQFSNNKDKSLHDKLIPFASQISEFEQLLSSSLQELFIDHPQPCSTMQQSLSPLSQLNFKSIKESLMKKEPVLVCSILKALRWRISRADNVYRRREAIIQVTSHNLLEFQLFSFLLEKKNRNITEHLLSLTNTIASEFLGRSYLIENTQFVKNLVQLMKMESSDTFIRKNCLGILQKLSLRKKPQEILIQCDLIKWTLNVLSNEKSTLSSYSLEYLSALILNLSLRTIGKNKFEEIRFSIMSFLRDYMHHPNQDIRTYVNGTMYSLFTRSSLRNLALEMGFAEKIETLIEQADDNLAKRYTYVLEHLLSDGIETTFSELNEDENDLDLIDEDEFWTEEENENAPEIDNEENGDVILQAFRLQGLEAEQQQQIVSAIMEETISQSRMEITRGGSRRKEDDHPRPSTPFKNAKVDLIERQKWDQEKG